MPNSEMDYQKYAPGSRVRPIVNPNREEIRNVLYGSEVICINYTGEPPEIIASDWNQRLARDAIALLKDEQDTYAGTIMLVLDPVIVPEYSDSVLSVEEIIEDVVSETLGTFEDEAADLIAESDQTHAEALIEAANEVDHFRLDGVVTRMLRLAIDKAREGLVENPF